MFWHAMKIICTTLWTMLKSVGIYLLFIVELILIKPWLDAENSFQYIYISNLNSTTNNSTVY